MKIGSTQKGWKFMYEVRVTVSSPHYYRGAIVLPTFEKSEDGRPRYTRYPALHTGSPRDIYATPAGVAKPATGVLLPQRN